MGKRSAIHAGAGEGRAIEQGGAAIEAVPPFPFAGTDFDFHRIGDGNGGGCWQCVAWDGTTGRLGVLCIKGARLLKEAANAQWRGR